MLEEREVDLHRPLALVGLTALAALVRFLALGTQSYWYDEVVTVGAVREPFSAMLSEVAAGESTPPLYFAVAWAWSRIFGDGEVALRSLSALVGTLTVPIAYLAARDLIGRRGALAVGTLTALSPALIWYSQEARAYALMTFLCAVSLLMFLRSLENPTTRNLAGWALASALALATHYFAALPVAAEAAWLLARAPNRRRVAGAVGIVAAVGLALLPLALHQRAQGNADWIGDTPVGDRIAQAAYFFAVGPGTERLGDHYEVAAAGVALAFAAAVALVLTRSQRRWRTGALLTLGLAAVTVGVPLLASLGGGDYFLDRNVLPAWLPLTIAGVGGLASNTAGKLGSIVVVGTCAAFALVDVRVIDSRAVQRDDWRGVTEALGPARSARIVEVAPGWQGKALSHYADGVELTAPSQPVSVVYTVAAVDAPVGGNPTAQAIPPKAPFQPVSTTVVQRFRITRYEAVQAEALDPGTLTGAGRDGAEAYLQEP
jgi:mannosyltransferase